MSSHPKRKKARPRKGRPKNDLAKKNLPDNPNLEHLRKHAKALLRSFKQKQPQVVARFRALKLRAAPNLSDAQHLVAREYGFDTWSKLKQHVDAETAAYQKAVRLAWKACRDDDVTAFLVVLRQYPILKARI